MNNQPSTRMLPQSLSDLVAGDDVLLEPTTQLDLATLDLACLGGTVTIDDLHQYVAALEQQHQELRQAKSVQVWFEALAKMTQHFQASFDETKIFSQILPELVQVLGGDGCELSLYNTSGSLVLVRYEYDARHSARVQRVDFPPEPPNVWSEITQFSGHHPDSSLDMFSLVAPIADVDGCLGVLQLKRREQAFGSAEQQFIVQVMAQLSIGLRRNRLAQLNQTQTVELKHLNHLQDAFLGTVSYELRIPLANMRMAIQMITLTLNRPEAAAILLPSASLDKVQQYLAVLHRECDRETKLVQDLLDLQQVDADMLSLVMAAIDLADWLPYVLKGFGKRARELDLTLNYSIEPGLPTFMSDQITLSRIVTELVGNACKFTPVGGSIQVDVSQQQQAGRSRLVIAVENTGVEIPIEEQGRVFDQFYRVSQMDIRRLGGIGLGLALVKRLAQRLGGDIQLVSHDGMTRFWVVLPLS
ncbi:HAMP domain-containing histidine kinase [filamentous cyanobacterium LEGE 11480]|uniref:histidine kinase n=1 Tax=Romeriopsis navalis LEGE 11480 TaxID=2777977 RepID=A0A928VLY6_9CYAN|nr:HAMP domain-containing sensor histidine kinase [Romeriopsis navalis]MBE9028792.1 HAMP domain-containing histidine kinase [Romeriopsis navalis LEGE 11480]